ncbi:Hsp70 family protein [Pochonia chlamydosporia 170]|uniref:Hsp70 family protein n=1 Tax=Pochonia chlamydosporia 170 TaxID=1380566 RepID=A0A179FZN7_METCM|nr:Hsp70 family protein [Pochonia chlamydosporia 170]OAQ70708.1 Hsp70 family protein [Pochonia chlamydosporia 170]
MNIMYSHIVGNSGISAPKIPTIIAYDEERPEDFKWGASVDALESGITGIKLLLDPEQARPLYLPSINVKKNLKELAKPPVEIAADFIGAIYKHALAEISKTVPKPYMDMCSKEFVVSVPAVWSDAAKNATLQAAKSAGIHPVTLIKEPEAAALHIVKSLDFSIKKGDAFVVCDAGGGTVDLISYEVEQIIPKLRVKELVPGTGGMAGSLGLNQRFAQAVHDLVGDDQWYILKKSKAWAMAQRQFDQEVKRAFKGERDEEEDLLRIFDPLIEDILRLIELQVQAIKLKRLKMGISGIMLVGGFGSSRYLMRRAKSHFLGIEVLQPQDAWAAIVKGSVLSQLPGQACVVSTSATMHYGTSACASYDLVEDAGQPTSVRRDGSIGVLKMEWFIKKGDDIHRDQKIKFPFFRSLEDDYTSEDLIFHDTLYQSRHNVAPVYPSTGKLMRETCSVRSDLTSVSKSHMIQKRDLLGVPYYDLHFHLVVSLQSAVMTFSLEVDGQTMGCVTVDYK